jgi:hypothetical protein
MEPRYRDVILHRTLFAKNISPRITFFALQCIHLLGTGTWLNMPPRVGPNFGELAEYGRSVGSRKKALQKKRG